jgi:serine/threonine-protein kinase
MKDINRYKDEELLANYCSTLLRVDSGSVSVSDEAIYAYLAGTASDGEKEKVGSALLTSNAFCEELLDLARCVDSVHRRARRKGIIDNVRGFLERKLASIKYGSRLRLAAASVATAIILVIGLLFVPRLWQPATIPTAKHLAVLPIECVEGDLVTEAFCNGLTGTVVEKLSRFERFYRSFWVVPAETVARKEVSNPEKAGRLFGVTMALTGRLQRLKDEFNLTMELVNVVSPTPKLLRSVQIVGPISQLYRLQLSVAEHISQMLSIDLVPEAQAALKAGDTHVSEAYTSYVEGRGYLLRYEKTGELEKAISAFSIAIDRDSSFALGYAGRAEAYWRMYRATRSTDWVEKAQEECLTAIEIDSSLAPTFVVFGNVLNEMGEYGQAIRRIGRALALDSTVAGAFNGLADAFAQSGRIREAESTYVQAIKVKPDYWGSYNDLGIFYYSNGRFSEASEQFRKVAELTPDNYLAFSNLGVMYYYLERWDDAKEAFAASIAVEPSDRAYVNLGSVYYIEGDYRRSAELCEEAIKINDANHRYWGALANAYYWIPGSREQSISAYRSAIQLAETRLEMNPKDARVLATLAGYYVMIDEKEKARSYADDALEISPDKPFVVYFAGHVYEQLGERGKALELIEKALELGYPLKEVQRDPWLSDFRADKRFKGLLEKQE